LLAGMGCITKSRVIGTWGSTMLYLFGIILFYFFPVRFSKKTFQIFIKWLVVLTIFWYVGLIIFSFLQTQLTIGYPHKKIMSDFNNTWDVETNRASLKYIGGNWRYIFQYRVYNYRRPKIILETFGYKNPWIDHNDVINSGAIIIAPTVDEVIDRTRETIILLPSNYKILSKKYVFNICNKLHQCNQEEFYYAIIPPMK